jgi:hypothetical protein
MQLVLSLFAWDGMFRSSHISLASLALIYCTYLIRVNISHFLHSSRKMWYILLYVGHAVVQLVEALRYKPEGRGFDSRWCHWNISLTYTFRPYYGPGVDSASNRNECQEYFLVGKGGRCVRLKALPPSITDCLENWEPQPPGILRTCPGL